MDSELQRLKTRLYEVHDLRMVANVLEWEQQTYMPPGGAEARAEQFATLKRLAHEKFVTDEIGQLLNNLSADGALGDYDSDDASLIRAKFLMTKCASPTCPKRGTQRCRIILVSRLPTIGLGFYKMFTGRQA